MDINEIARLAGVSRATVSRYLNNGYVSQEKRELISKVIQETGYIPSQSAQQHRKGQEDLGARGEDGKAAGGPDELRHAGADVRQAAE